MEAYIEYNSCSCFFSLKALYILLFIGIGAHAQGQCSEDDVEPVYILSTQQNFLNFCFAEEAGYSSDEYAFGICVDGTCYDHDPVQSVFFFDPNEPQPEICEDFIITILNPGATLDPNSGQLVLDCQDVPSVPVCGCNGVTYPSACVAEANGVRVYTVGSCFDDCVNIPDLSSTTCPTVYDPVCACNGETYSNSCLAEKAGVKSWTAGTCGGSSTSWCSDAIPIQCGDVIYDELLISDGNDFVDYNCFPNASFNGYDKVYAIQKDVAGNLQIGFEIEYENPNSTLDLDIFLLDGDCNQIRCLTSSTQNNRVTNNEAIDINLGIGTYYLVVDTERQTQRGKYRIEIGCSELVCLGAKKLFCGNTLVNESNAFGRDNVITYVAGRVINVDNNGNEMVYEFTLDSSEEVEISLTNATAAYAMFLLETCDRKSAIAFEQNENDLNGNPQTGDMFIQRTLDAGTYYLVVDGYYGPGTSTIGAVGNYDLTLNVIRQACSRPETCSEAILITQEGRYSAQGPDKGNGCFNCTDAQHASWYHYQPNEDGYVSISSCNANVNTRLFFYEGLDCNNLIEIARSDDDCISSGTQLLASLVEGIPVDANLNYYLEWDNRWSEAPFEFTLSFASSAIDRQNDSLALVRFYNATGGPNWTIPWDLNQPMDTWFGIVLNAAGRVTCIDLDGDANCSSLGMGTGNNLTGFLPEQIGDLDQLESLILSGNFIVGTLPNTILNLSNLLELDLSDNFFLGAIPEGFTTIASLQTLNLDNNQFSGCLPEDLRSFCNTSANINLDNNPELPWSGNFDLWCREPNQIGTICNDQDSSTVNDVITSDCNCIGTLIATERNCLVTNVNDSGPGSLREAINCANQNRGKDSITFQIAGNGPHEIFLERNLPALEDDSTIIDATTLVNWERGQLIINGQNNANITDGIVIRADHIEIYGLMITGFSSGIRVFGRQFTIGAENKGNVVSNNGRNTSLGTNIEIEPNASNGIIQETYIGTGATGRDTITPNTNYYGILSAGDSIQILNNVIAGNGWRGIDLRNWYTEEPISIPQSITITGNKIGVDITGTVALGNKSAGIDLGDCSNVLIEDNIISGNLSAGVLFWATEGENILIQENKIGTDISGSQAIPNEGPGIGSWIFSGASYRVQNVIIGGKKPNTIAYNEDSGILITDDFRATIARNEIYCNEQKGIDLSIDGNQLKAAPIINTATPQSINGTAEVGDFIQVYMENDLCSDCLVGNPQASIYLGEVRSDDGTWVLSDLAVAGLPGRFITAIATNTDGNSSEFATCFQMQDIENCIIDTIITARICQGGTFAFNDRLLQAPGNYRDRLVSSGGCDSIILLNLLVDPLPQISNGSIRVENCVLGGSTINVPRLPSEIINWYTVPTGGQILTTRSDDIQFAESGTYYAEKLDTLTGCISENRFEVAYLRLDIDTLRSMRRVCSIEEQRIDTLIDRINCKVEIVETLAHSTFVQDFGEVLICNGDSFRGRMQAGTYSDSLQTIFGCDSIINFSIQVSDLQVEIMGKNNFCDNQISTLTAQVNGGQAPFQYRWNTGSSVAITNIGGAVNNATVTVTDATGCTVSRQLDLTILESPQVNIEGSQTVCEGIFANLLASGGDNYSWSNGANTSEVLLEGGQTYSVTVSNDNNCTTVISGIDILELDRPDAPRSPINYVMACPGDLPLLDVEFPILEVVEDSNQTYNWYDAAGNLLLAQSSTYATDDFGSYFVAAIDTMTGCESQQRLEIFVTEDFEPPQFLTCPEDQAIRLNLGMEQSIRAYWDEPTVIGDFCRHLVFSNISSGSSFSRPTEIIYTAFDFSNNTSECRFMISPIPTDTMTLVIDSTEISYKDGRFHFPVKVQNFANIQGLQFALNISGENSKITGVNNIHPELMLDVNGSQNTPIEIDSDQSVRLVWFDFNSSNGLSLPDNTTLFTLELNLNREAGSCTELFFADDPIQMELVRSDSISLQPSFVNMQFCIPSMLNLSGRIASELAIGLEDVEVFLDNELFNLNQVNSTEEGDYKFTEIETGSIYNIRPFLDSDPLNGVTVVDLAMIQAYRLRRYNLESPYKIIAADINADQRITIVDLTELQALKLGRINQFQSNTSWRFIDSLYIFNDPTAPLLEDFPESIQLDTSYFSRSHLSFIAVKTGDLNNSVETEDLINTPLIPFFVENQNFQPGDLIEVDFWAPRDIKLDGFQFGLKFDEQTLSFESIDYSNETFGVDAKAFNTTTTDKGELSVLWFDKSEEINLRNVGQSNDSKLLFTLVFKANEQGSIDNVMQLHPQLMQAIAAVNYQAYPLELAWTEPNVTQMLFEDYGPQPNPFTNTTELHFYHSISEWVELEIYNMMGQQIIYHKERLEAGRKHIPIDAHSLTTSGTYFYTLRAASGSSSGKLILQK